MLGTGAAWWRGSIRRSSTAGANQLFEAVFDDADGVRQPLAQWRGTLLVVNFWATWCAPCVDEMPALNQVRNEYRRRGVEIVGVGIDSAEKIRAFRARLGLGLPLLVAGAGGSELARALGNVTGVLPYTVLVTRAGAVEQRHIGQIQPDELKAWLDARVSKS